MTTENPVLQNILQNLEIFPSCIKYTFGNALWQKCNYDSKLNLLGFPLGNAFNNTNGLINLSKNKINGTISNTTNLITNINRQIVWI